MSGIVAALEAHHHVGLFGQPVDDLALALVAPLRPDDDHIGHEASLFPALARRGLAAYPMFGLGLANAGRRVKVASSRFVQAHRGKIAEIRKNFAGTSVTATEPVFGYMAAALSFRMRNERHRSRACERYRASGFWRCHSRGHADGRAGSRRSGLDDSAVARASAQRGA